MKTTKNCNSNGCKSTKSKSTTGTSRKSTKSARNTQQSESDPDGSYTGNPVGWGKYEQPVQDADDL